MEYTIEVKAPAKINLSLDITGRRGDGYHYMDMVMQAVSLYDRIRIQLTHDRNIVIIADNENVPTGEDSILFRCVQLFYAKCMQKFSGVEIHINKHIPLMAGLGGGSSDVAAVLIGLNALEQTNYSLEILQDIGAKLGADVGFFITGGTCHVTGVGEQVEAVSALPQCHILLVKPAMGVSTPQAFAEYDKTPIRFQGNNKALIQALEAGSLQGVCTNMDNVFTSLCQVPEVSTFLGVLRGAGALTAQMSGTGSTVYGIFTDEERAKVLFQRLKTVCKDVFLVTPVETGAEVLL